MELESGGDLPASPFLALLQAVRPYFGSFLAWFLLIREAGR